MGLKMDDVSSFICVSFKEKFKVCSLLLSVKRNESTEAAGCVS